MLLRHPRCTVKWIFIPQGPTFMLGEVGHISYSIPQTVIAWYSK